jgi:hypothetical protein
MADKLIPTIIMFGTEAELQDHGIEPPAFDYEDGKLYVYDGESQSFLPAVLDEHPAKDLQRLSRG